MKLSIIRKNEELIILSHLTFLNTFINLDLFWFCALAGSGMFFMQFILNFFGILNQESLNTGDGAFSDQPLDLDSSDARTIKWFSIQAITGFLMMFGWTAITCQSEFGFQNATTLVISSASGIFTAIITRFIFKIAKYLQSSGTTFRIEDSIGQDAYVYQSIPKGGMGKVSISLHHFTHEINAISHHDEELPSFVRVKIIKINDHSSVVVTPI